MTSGLVKRGFTYITNDWAKLFMYMVSERERERSNFIINNWIGA